MTEPGGCGCAGASSGIEARFGERRDQAVFSVDGCASALLGAGGLRVLLEHRLRRLADLGRRHAQGCSATSGHSRLRGIHRPSAKPRRYPNTLRRGGTGHARFRYSTAANRRRAAARYPAARGGECLCAGTAGRLWPTGRSSRSARRLVLAGRNHATPARNRSWKWTMPTGRPFSTTISAVIFDELSICSASLAN